MEAPGAGFLGGPEEDALRPEQSTPPPPHPSGQTDPWARSTGNEGRENEGNPAYSARLGREMPVKEKDVDGEDLKR